MAKIFISHSSEDKDIVDLFKNIILNAGLGISDNDIVYTSAPETGVPTGGNIPQYIKENIADSDLVFFMISDNYRKSEVCLNEMGAAWALDKNVKPLLLRDVSFKSVGWLYGMNLCAKINDAERLDGLRDEFLDKYDSCPKTAVWSRQKAEFLAKMATLYTATTTIICAEVHPENAESIEVVEELGILDYRAIFDEHTAQFVQNMKIVSNSMNESSPKVRKIAAQWQNAKKYSYKDSAKRKIMQALAEEMNFMSNVIEENANSLQEKYEKMIDAAVAIQQFSDGDINVKMNNRQAFDSLKQTVISTKDSLVDTYNVVNNIEDIEKTQIAAKKRFLKALKELIHVCDGWSAKTTEPLIA